MENFTFKNINLRCIKIDGEPWFVANDVAECLGHSKAHYSNAISKFTSVDDRKSLKYKASRESGEADLKDLWGKNDFMDKVLINESGLYCMIFGSKTEAAKEFKLWVTREVLPSIRKNGGYIEDQEYLSKEAMEKISKGILKLSRQVKELTASNEKYKKRWHELIAENTKTKARWHKLVAEKNLLKEDKRELKKSNKKLLLNIKLLNEDNNDTLRIMEKMCEDMANLKDQLQVAKSKPTYSPSPTPVFTYTVDREGRLVG